MHTSRADATTDATLNEMLASLGSDTEKKSSTDEPNDREEGIKKKTGLKSGYSTKESEAFNNVLPEEDKRQGSISFRTYLVYCKEGAWCFLLCFMVVLFVMTQVSTHTARQLTGKNVQ